MKATLEEAYTEACQALGEAIVRERLVMKKAYFPEDEAEEVLDGPKGVANAGDQRDNQRGHKENGKLPEPTAP